MSTNFSKGFNLNLQALPNSIPRSFNLIMSCISAAGSSAHPTDRNNFSTALGMSHDQGLSYPELEYSWHVVIDANLPLSC